MSRIVASEHRRRRWWIATFAFCVVTGLQLAALPPALFAGSLDECVMSCSAEGRECCCKGSATAAGHHASEAPADGRLSLARPLCRELCAAVANKAPGGESWLLAGIRPGPARPGPEDRIARSRAALRGLDHGDPSTLPRPPPGPVAPF